MATGPVQAQRRVVGDDWVFHASTDDDVADHTGLVAQLRYATGGELVADSQADPATLVLDGVDDEAAHLVVPASEFTESGGQLWAVVRRSVTRGIRPDSSLVLQFSVDAVSLAGRRTIGTVTFRTAAQVAVEVAP